MRCRSCLRCRLPLCLLLLLLPLPVILLLLLLLLLRWWRQRRLGLPAGRLWRALRCLLPLLWHISTARRALFIGKAHSTTALGGPVLSRRRAALNAR